MQIKEVSEKFNIKEDTLRYYEKVGMIPPVHRTSSGIRDYNETDLGWVELVLCMRKTGLPIQAIVEFVNLSKEGDTTLAKRLDLLQEQREILIQERIQMDQMLGRLDHKIDYHKKKLQKNEH